MSHPREKAGATGPAAAKSKDSLPLILLLVALAGVGLIIGLPGEGGGHWMQGPALTIMVAFMPLSAITYLHYRLPRKQEEFEAIRAVLNVGDDPEVFTSVIEQEESSADYLLPIFFVSVFSVLGFYVLFSDTGAVLLNGAEWVGQDHDLYTSERLRRNIVALGMAFLGAYIWSIQYIFRRMMTLDLPAGAYYSVGTRMIYSTFIAVVLQYLTWGPLTASGDPASGATSSNFIVVSFLIGIFPERALSWMRDTAGRMFAQPKHSADPLPLEMIEGISGFHKARLFELGIDSIQNLAHASLMELILKTPFRPRVLVDWMAQARLCLEFKEHTNRIRGAGVRTILDLQEVAGRSDGASLAEVAKNSGVDVTLIQTVYLANRDEKSLQRLREAYDVLNIV